MHTPTPTPTPAPNSNPSPDRDPALVCRVSDAPRGALGWMCVLACLSGTAIAQPYNRVAGEANRWISMEDATADASGEITLAGETYSNFTFRPDAAVTRLSVDGVPLWTTLLSFTPQFASAMGVRAAASGDLLVFSRAYDFSAGSALYLSSLTPAGAHNWTRAYAGGAPFENGALELRGAAAWMVSPYSGTLGNGGQVVRASAADGLVISSDVYLPAPGLASALRFHDLATDNSSIYVAGTIDLQQDDVFDQDILVARINLSGNVVWATAIGQTQLDPSVRGDEGVGIELVPGVGLVVVGRTASPGDPFGPTAAVHLRLDPVSGVLQQKSVIGDVQAAHASLDLLSSGRLLACGNRTFGDGDSAAQMWQLDPLTLQLDWRREYADGRTFGNDAIETSGVPFLAGSTLPGSVPPIGSNNILAIRTNAAGDDLCSSFELAPDTIPAEITQRFVSLVRGVPEGEVSSSVNVSTATLISVRLCDQVNPCPADLTGDGFVDDADFVVFAACYEQFVAFPGCEAADFNADGFVDDGDFVIFAAAYEAFICP